MTKFDKHVFLHSSMLYPIPTIEIGKQRAKTSFSVSRAKNSGPNLYRNTTSLSSNYHPLSARNIEFNIEKAKSYSADDIINILNTYFSRYIYTVKEFIQYCSIDKIQPKLIFALKDMEYTFTTFVSSILSMKKGNTRSPSSLTSRTITTLSTNSSRSGKVQQTQIISATIRKYCRQLSDSWNMLYQQIVITIKAGDPPLFTLFCNLLGELLHALSELHDATEDIIPTLVNSERHYEKMIDYIKILRRTCQLYSISLEKSGPFLVELGVKFGKIANGVNKYIHVNASKTSMYTSVFHTKKSQCAGILNELNQVMDSILCFTEVSHNCKKTALETTIVFAQAMGIINLSFTPDFDPTEELEIMKNEENEKLKEQQSMNQEQDRQSNKNMDSSSDASSITRSSTSSITIPAYLQQDMEDMAKLHKQISEKHVTLILKEEELKRLKEQIVNQSSTRSVSLKPKKKKKNAIRQKPNAYTIAKKQAIKKGKPELIVFGNKTF